ncbi:putative transcription factor C2C2-GATA family [Helianthus annuus]|uniref:GATA transcription factor n=1 Tax=Helianthus annuus TaxID=4232 RepID=A0A251UZD4_HELAN|nr:GATA transcription factor 12 [Helianthus annuus]KAF5823933.1 putative transcription factor C2C2-GATA family [Helianthus annuus]KAJ0624924.1 putative transcription factor C2C2-GATA family [Helianthus annuus]KAJ0628593.1 putative transcription factor C2C2-GATA family [Helianthus annuus]KAJ0784922.1 putative transcription factor C2C2-GATA family [Helianthus annuus]KAJ0794179.1 putative transcription factor C2C2-GATA family [Helianthus annuus]
METPQFFHANTQQFTPEKRHSDVKTDHFIIDDLLNFPNDDTDEPYDVVADTNDSSIVTTTVDSCNSSGDVARRSLTDTQFSHDLCVPHDDMAELEWLSNFVEESFSSEDMEKLRLLSGVKSRPVEASETQKFQHDVDNQTNNAMFDKDVAVPAKARTKRSRAAPRNWTSRLVGLSQPSMGPTPLVSSESESDIGPSLIGKKAVKALPKKKEVYDNDSHNGEGRKCLHCATDKTPQWRTGPLGPKTLCNACGVRYKSGRLVPEYRPASSPTFVLAKHSNSHRKVLELRRQKEMQSVHQQPFFHHQNMIFDVPKGEDYLIHQHIGPDYRQLI